MSQSTPSPNTRYCFGSNCYPSLYQAELELRASGAPYGELWRRTATEQESVDDAGVVLLYRYVVDDQPPVKLYPFGYMIGGGGTNSVDCVPVQDPHAPYRCAREDDAIEAYMAKLRMGSDCQFADMGTVGEYREPYSNIQSQGQTGIVRLFASAANFSQRYLRISTWCPAWSPPQPPSTSEVWLTKWQSVECAEGFRVKDVADGDDADWPNICRAVDRERSIRAYAITQTESECINRNPCFPATGDKARAEVQFTFAGREFFLHYHSLNQVQGYGELGVGWSHSYSDFVMSFYRQSRVDDRGYIQTYGAASRGIRRAGEVLRAGPGGTSELIEADGTRRIYSATGHLIRVDTARPSTSVVLERDGFGRVSRVIDGLGRALIFKYENRRLAKIVLPNGAEVKYGYDGFGNLISASRPDGSFRNYIYNEAEHAPAGFRHLMTGIVESGQRYATFSYDMRGRVVASRLNDAGKIVDSTRITYSPDGSAASTGSLGDIRQHQISGVQYRNITSTSDSRGVRGAVFSGAGRIASRSDALGGVTSFSYSDFGSGAVSQIASITEESIDRTTRTVRDANNQIVEERVTQKVAGVEKLVSLKRVVPDAYGRIHYTCHYDATQPIDYVCGALELAPGNVRQIRYSYCSEVDVAVSPSVCPLVGLHRSTRDPAGNVTWFEYYSADAPGCETGTSCPYRKGDQRAQVNSLGQRIEFLEYDASGNAIRIQGIDGAEVERLYDAMGRLTSVALRGGAPADDRISLFEYSSTGKITRAAMPDGGWIQLHYDTADRLVSTEDSLGNKVLYTLDAAGNHVSEEARDVTGALRKVIGRTFDSAGRETRVVDARGYAKVRRYDGNNNVLEFEDALGVITKQTYDGVDRLLTEEQDSGDISARIAYEYASDGQVAAITDPKGLRTTYRYNGFGDQIGIVSPDVGAITFTVDANGNRRTLADARGVTSTYSYDALNRLIGVAYPNPNLDVGYSYDVAPAACTAEERFAQGRLGQVLHANGSTQYCHDRFGQVTRKVQTVNGVASTLRYAYSKSGRLTALTYPDGSVADYVRDTQGRISQIGLTRPGHARQIVVNNVTYAAFGPATGWTYGNGRQLQRPLDLDYRPQAVHDPAAGGLSLSFGYDPVGSITELKNGAGSTVLAKYAYDTLGRLTQTRDGATGTPIETYAYDATGNRTALTTSAGTASYTYPATSHRLTAVDGEARNHDAAGNTTSIGSKTFTYNDANRMNAVKHDDAVLESYGYNHRGERVLRSPASGAAQITMYDETGQWLGNYSATGQALQQAIWLDNYPVALINVRGNGVPELAYVQPDHLGTPRVVIDPVRNVAIWEWSNKSEVFGNQIPSADPDGDGVAFELGLRFPGQQATDASGLFYNYQREYDPTVGRYSQSDPLGLAPSISSYSYIDSSPLMFYDPLGLEKRQQCLAIGEYAGAACGALAGGYVGGMLGTAGGGAACSPTGPGALACAGAGGLSGAAAGGFAGSLLGQRAGRAAAEALCPEDDDKCDKKLDARMLRKAGIAGSEHDVKIDWLGTNKNISLYDLCGCDDGRVVLKPRGCRGPVVEVTNYRWK
ncbi:TPA: RHS repeat protein [Stenotrophomonas maltophilia]|nr:RHS repeat protein [Stenotrophomonas maltophilia]